MPPKREPWLVTIESAKTTDELLVTLPNADASPLQGLLLRHQLADPELQMERVEAIKKAVKEGTISPEALFSWRDDVLAAESAIEGIADFRQKHVVIEAFRQKHNREANREDFVPSPGKNRVVFAPGNDGVVLKNIRTEIWRENLPLAEWVEFLDARRDETERHIFLFSLPHANFPSAPVIQKFTWKVEQPVLSEWQVDAQQNVRLKWIGWRSNANNNRGTRVVTFATIHPQRRRMELCIQRLRSGGMQAVIDERDAYLHEAAVQLNMQPEAVRLEPAIRELLKNRRLELKHWMVRTPKGGELSGKGEPGLFEKVRLGFDRYYALELKGEWTPDATTRVSIRMDARTDAIDVRTQCKETALRELISAAWGNIDSSTVVKVNVTKGPKTFKDDREATARKAQLEKLVEYLTRLGEPVPLRRPPKEKPNELQFATKTRKDLRFSAKTLEDALQQFGVRVVGLTLYVMCTDTMTAASRADQVIEFDRPGDIPEEIECDNTGAVRRHHTQDNVWLKVGPPTDGGGGISKWIWIVISIYLALLTALFVWLTSRYPGARSLGFLAVGFLLSALAPIASIHLIYGPTAFKAAGDMVRSLLDILLSKGRSESEEQEDSDDFVEDEGDEKDDADGQEDENTDEDEKK